MIAERFQKAILSKGHTATIDGNQLTIPSTGMIVKLDELQTVHDVGFVGVEVLHPSLLPDGLKDVAVGLGADDITRSKAAINAWMFTDYPVLYTYMSPTKVDMGVYSLSLVSQHGNEVLGWRVLIGPLYSHGYATNLGKDSELEMYHVISNNFLPYLTSPEVFAMKLTMSVNTDGRVIATCRMKGGVWNEGSEALLKLAKTIFNTPGEHYREQYLLIIPRPISEIEPSSIDALKQDFVKATEELMAKRKNRRRWFQFWKAK